MRSTLFLGTASLLLLAGCGQKAPEQSAFATTYTTDRSATALTHPVSGLDNDQTDRFILGKSFFRIPWVEPPSATTARDGLGPLFNANTCMHCHPNNGAGSTTDGSMTGSETSRALVLRLSRSESKDLHSLHHLGFVPDSRYGAQLSINGVFGVPYEGKVGVRTQSISGTYPDGTPYRLEKPEFFADDLQYGALDGDTVVAPRIAPPLVGLGKIELIDDAAFLAHADPEDKNGDGISGRPNRVYSPESQSIRLGRYTWKGAAPTVKHQVAAAFSNDMGLTSPLFPEETCTKSQTECLKAPKARHPIDVTNERLDAVSYYLTHLKAPAHPVGFKEEKAAFESIGCAACHVPAYTGRNGETIRPYGDFLLHDMGEDLADGRSEFAASGTEWRTAPLWGLGIQNGAHPRRYLHDGRARTVEEAILWHGGEAERAKKTFMQLSQEARDNLIRFLEHL